MDKFAQRRSLLNKIKEKTNVSGIAAEKFFNPEFERVMDALRTVDNKVRAIASGKNIDGEDPDDGFGSMKSLLKEVKSNLNRREYMTAVSFLGKFHSKLENIVKEIEKLNGNVDQVHHDFLFKDLDDEHKDYLHNMKSRFANRKMMLEKKAGIMDFLANISTERGRALAHWEKRYPNQVKKLKNETLNLLNKADNSLSNLLNVLKEMANYRAARKVDEYMKEANKIVVIFNKFDGLFKEYYKNNIKGFLDKVELKATQKEVVQETVVEAPISQVQSIPAPVPTAPSEQEDNEPILLNRYPDTQPAPAQRSSELEEMYQAIQNKGGLPASPRVPTIPDATETDEELIDSVEDENTKLSPVSVAHKDFIKGLEVLSEEHPVFVAKYIRKYATKIQHSHPEQALQLFKIAKNVGQ